MTHALVSDGEGWRDKDCPMDHIPEPCPVCNALAKARADERAAIHRALDAEKPRWVAEMRADERERVADLLLMKFSMTSARSHDSGCVCILCAINSTLDAAVDWLRGGESIDLAEEYDRAQNGWGMFDEVDR